MQNNNDLSSMVEGILKNPEFTGLVNGLRSDTESKAPEVTTEDIMSRLPEVMSMLGPIVNGMTSDTKSADTESKPDERRDKPESKQLNIKKGDKAQAEKLMSALKPYLNKNRCEIIDRCVSVMQITDVMDALKGIEEIGKKGRND